MASKAKEAKKSEEKPLILIKKLVEKLLGLLGSNAGVEVEEDKSNEAMVVSILAEDDAGLLIGNRGKTLNDLQAILGMIFKRKTGEWKRIIVDVSGWREKEQRRLVDLAKQAVERVRTTGEPQALYNLSPSQRRIVHVSLADDKDVQTESHGEEAERYLLISPKKTTSTNRK